MGQEPSDHEQGASTCARARSVPPRLQRAQEGARRGRTGALREAGVKSMMKAFRRLRTAPGPGWEAR